MSKYLDNMYAAAVTVTNPAEAFQLVSYINNTVHHAGTPEDDAERFNVLRTVTSYWSEYGCYEDGMSPALDIMAALTMFGNSSPSRLADMVKKTMLHAKFEQNVEESYAVDCSYEEFCDAFSLILNG